MLCADIPPPLRHHIGVQLVLTTKSGSNYILRTVYATEEIRIPLAQLKKLEVRCETNIFWSNEVSILIAVGIIQ